MKARQHLCGEIPMRKRLLPALMPLIAVLIFTLQQTPASAAAPAASARYQSVSGNTVVFVVDVGSPAPSSLILQHIHPAQRKLVSSSPRADKIYNARGVCKWLIKNSRSGTYPFSLTFDGPVSGNDISLILRYRHPSTKTFKEITVKP